ncbi:PREDICTED: speckle-type POZ protein-like, partial [Rhagoletis zephyria]|uniref:speckle-type POZ protein-like n=1 Tax=Rhagoletis zephyria TaxID=28612 RepID=UPI0008116BF1
LKKGSWVELFQADHEYKEKLCSQTQCDGHFMNIEVKITIFDNEEPSFLATWNSFGSFKAVNHADTLCQNLAVFGAESSFADVTVCTVADGKEFKVHSTILAMRSPVFAAMFAEGNFKESQEKKVYIEDFDGQVMGAFIDYLYGRKNTEWKSFAGDLAKVADKYDVPSLFTACVTSLAAEVNVENASKNFYYAYQLGMPNCMNEIAQFIVKNKAAVMATDGWKEYFFQDVKLLGALFSII